MRQQTITADQLAELEALTPSVAAQKPIAAHLSAPTILAGGFETKHAFCDKGAIVRPELSEEFV
jgi:hypothetical protein